MTLEPIAIIGIGCRFPGGIHSPTRFWNFLQAGGDAIQEVPANRWHPDRFYDPDPVALGKMNTRWGGFLDQIDHFDAAFFGISKAEATRIDPQQRLLLEVAWEAIEDAGQRLDQLAGSDTGVFIGVINRDYSYLQLGDRDRDTMTAHTAISSNLNMVPNRISYWFDLRGPSLPVDAACASSLAAVHLACSSIWQGDCSMALAGGVNLIFKPEISIAMSQAFLLAADGRCKSFAATGDGLGRAEGAGIVVLKPLSQAVADGDAIYAVIRGSAMNQNGRGSSFTAPDEQAQRAAIQKAYDRAGISPQQVQYVEAHGSGAPLSDEAEANAIGAVIGGDRPFGQDCAIGSVKANIGHTEGAAGIASVIKAALAIAHRQIPVQIHSDPPNPRIPWQQLRLRLPIASEPLVETEQGFPVVGVHAVAAGGINVHLVLQGVQPQFSRSTSVPSNSPSLFVLSAHCPEALQELAKTYLNWLTLPSTQSIPLDHLCYTLSLRRSHLRDRLACVVDSYSQLIDDLNAFLSHSYSPEPSRSDSLYALAAQYLQGESIDWLSLYPHAKPPLQGLPSYPWQRKRYWHESEASRQNRLESDEHVTNESSPLVHLADTDNLHKDNLHELDAANVLQESTILQEWSEATGDDRLQRLVCYFQLQVAQALSCAPSQLDVQQPLNGLGIDSLTAVSFRGQIANHLNIDVPIEELIASPSIAELAQICHERLILQRLHESHENKSHENVSETVEEMETITI